MSPENEIKLPTEQFVLAGVMEDGRVKFVTYTVDQAADAKAALIMARQHGHPAVLYACTRMKL